MTISDELTHEQAEIIRNARAAYKAHKIDRWQLWDVYRMVARAISSDAEGGAVKTDVLLTDLTSLV